ncbi:putative oxidoreductase [Labrenzia sp. EL_208]|nr:MULTISPECIES: DoxX family protein [Stappiaceae]MBG6141995.1 putative oxidoreductase [Labrenzia sp. EL_142]MBG6159480.1 putative oxidoreductase [Labrenzia sp. EL_162]MBG6164230.1 putative oxidoreductase [Labrenzia sp. EL_195]MBG6175862.1 putative oxidoreductase [Labrenzia sp. EL_132]MBG6198122.1 putative oxidoreductase [Labrenzia sp. EL_159]MBG6204436.1 putative oxidoreductase [Labrenzia sp. EL_13]MBG6208733.1 putative oxidoreductase [Labrenzia sp. EL_126]MBG6230377.1 putative oxidoreduct
MGALIGFFVRLYTAVFGTLERITNGWLLGLASRFIFAAVLLQFFLNSAMTKIGGSITNIFTPTAGAYAQMLPQMMEQVSYDTSQIAFFPYGLMVLAGTWGEFILPVLVVVGLFTRFASLGMIVFIIVMSYVDITGHGADAKTIGALFDGEPYAIISDDRLLWIFLLLVPTLKGPGVISLDWLFGRMYRKREMYY